MTTRTSSRSSIDTKDQILQAAEKLFAEHGIAGASLRAITREAGVNLAAVHYHFGSKEGLIRAVLGRRLRPLNESRLRRLGRLEATAGEGQPDLAGVVRAFVGPPLEMVRRERGGHDFARFVLRTFSQPDPELRQIVLDEFEDVIREFTRVLTISLPDVPEEEVVWRFHFMVGSLTHTAGLGFLIHQLSEGRCEPIDVDGVIDRLTTFLTAGLGAPATAGFEIPR